MNNDGNNTDIGRVSIEFAADGSLPITATNEVAEVLDKELSAIRDKKQNVCYTDEKGRFLIGEMYGGFNQKAHLAKQSKVRYRSNIIADNVDFDELQCFAFSKRGEMHFATSTIRQDSYAIAGYPVERYGTSFGTRYFVAAVADGVSSAARSHQLADAMVCAATSTVTEVLEEFDGSDITLIDWVAISDKLVLESLLFCRKLLKREYESLEKDVEEIEAIPAKAYTDYWATTLEFVVVESVKSCDGFRKYVHVAVTGDGSAYVVGDNGFSKVRNGKENTGFFASNAVKNPLPMNPIKQSVNTGKLGSQDIFLLVTDGFGDLINNKNSGFTEFLNDKLINSTNCRSLPSLFQIFEAATYQMDDDRTCVLIREKEKD